MTTKRTSATVAVSAEHQSKLEAAHADMITELGREIILSTGELAGKYMKLCLYIRKNEVAPKLVSLELTRLGFHKVRISEINKVAHASDKLFKEWTAKTVGFNKVLEMARQEASGVKTLTPAAKMLVEGDVLNAEDVDAAIEAETAHGDGGTKGAKTPSMSTRIKNAAMFICKNATRPATFRSKDTAWIVTVTKAPKTGPAVGDDKE